MSRGQCVFAGRYFSEGKSSGFVGRGDKRRAGLVARSSTKAPPTASVLSSF
jgi:hypothetical protein